MTKHLRPLFPPLAPKSVTVQRHRLVGTSIDDWPADDWLASGVFTGKGCEEAVLESLVALKGRASVSKCTIAAPPQSSPNSDLLSSLSDKGMDTVEKESDPAVSDAKCVRGWRLVRPMPHTETNLPPNIVDGKVRAASNGATLQYSVEWSEVDSGAEEDLGKIHRHMLQLSLMMPENTPLAYSRTRPSMSLKGRTPPRGQEAPIFVPIWRKEVTSMSENVPARQDGTNFAEEAARRTDASLQQLDGASMRSFSVADLAACSPGMDAIAVWLRARTRRQQSISLAKLLCSELYSVIMISCMPGETAIAEALCAEVAGVHHFFFHGIVEKPPSLGQMRLPALRHRPCRLWLEEDKGVNTNRDQCDESVTPKESAL